MTLFFLSQMIELNLVLRTIPRNRNTIEFLGLWETLHNPNFNRVQFDTFKNEAGLNRFVMTPSKWIDLTDAIGIVTIITGVFLSQHEL